MSLHKSLKINKFGSKKTVRTRQERIKKLLDEGKMTLDNLQIYNLPKEKIKKVKIKKQEKKEKEEITNV